MPRRDGLRIVSEHAVKCKYCTLKIVDIGKHVREKHNDGKLFPCAECPQILPSRVTYRLHFDRKHVTTKDWKCEICEKCFTSKETLYQHTRKVHGERTWKCPKCDNVYFNKEKLESHLISHSTELKFSCQMCEFGTKREVNLRSHMTTHERGKYVKPTGVKRRCPHCYSMFVKLEGHIRDMHNDGQMFECQQCEYITKTKVVLEAHHRHLHMDDAEARTHECTWCDTKCKSRSALQKHVKHVHTNCRDKVFECDECPYKTHLDALLKGHKRLHGEKEFECHLCDYRCHARLRLVGHLAVQHNSGGAAIQFDLPECFVVVEQVP